MDEDFDFEDSKDLEDGIDNEKHWKSLSIASAVISVICIIIIIAIILLTPASGDGGNLEPYSLEEVISKQMLNGHHFNGTWVSDHEFIYQAADKNIVLYDCQSGSHQVITNKLNTTNKQIVAFQMSPLRTFLLVATGEEKTKASHLSAADCEAPLEYFLYDLGNGNILNLAEELRSRLEKKRKASEKDASVKKTNSWSKSLENTQRCAIQSAEWAPRGELILAVANDIYRLRLDQSSSADDIERLTEDGTSENTILNGINDDIYRDLIFGKWSSLWWSRNVSRQFLCFLKLNNSAVPFASMTIYPEGSSSYLRHFRYPTIDSTIGEATLWVVDLSDERAKRRKVVRIEPPKKATLREHFVTFVDWTPSDQLLAVWTQRNQKRSVVGICAANDNWRCQELATLKNWSPLKHLPGSILAASNNANEYFLCCQIPENGEKAFHQLYSLNTQTKAITPYLNMADIGTDWQYHRISQLLAYNDDAKLVFFVGLSLSRVNSETVVTEQDMRPNVFVFSLRYGTVQCITCRLVGCQRNKNSQSSEAQSAVCLDAGNVSRSSGIDSDVDSCLFQSAQFGPSAQFAVITCFTGIVPRVYLVHFSRLANLDGPSDRDIVQNITLFEDNLELEQRIAAKIIPNVETFVISREHGSTLKYLRLKILTPHDFSSSHSAKYPLLFQFGPPVFVAQSGNRNDREYQREPFPDTEWAIHMVTKHQIIFAWLDGHLTEDYSYASNDESLEEQIDDYNALLEYMQLNMTFVNLQQTCLLGSNVGGSLVLLTLSNSPTSAFNCGLAISPVVDWHSINTLLAELYLDWERFESGDLSYLLKINLNHSTLNSKSMFLSHGTANALVPMSNSMQLLRDLALDQIKSHWPRPAASDNTTDETAATGAHMFEPLVNQGNKADTLLEHFYRKVEFFLFKFIIAHTSTA